MELYDKAHFEIVKDKDGPVIGLRRGAVEKIFEPELLLSS
jgi:hypothetical protein